MGNRHRRRGSGRGGHGTALTQHHRKCKSRGGDNSPANISWVHWRLHNAWHLLFDNLPPEIVCRIINTIWIDPHYKFVCVKRKHTLPNKQNNS